MRGFTVCVPDLCIMSLNIICLRKRDDSRVEKMYTGDGVEFSSDGLMLPSCFLVPTTLPPSLHIFSHESCPPKFASISVAYKG